MIEIWKAIPGFEGSYEVSNLGNARSLPREIVATNRWGGVNVYTRPSRPLRPYVNTARGGYRYVNLNVDGQQNMRRVARLVASAFLGPPPEGMHVCHNNGTPTDDRVENLRYGTPKENSADTDRHGRRQKGATHHQVRITEADARRIKYGSEPSDALAEELGVHVGHIDNIRRGHRWAHV